MIDNNDPRYTAIRDLREKGWTYQAIANFMNLSLARIRQLAYLMNGNCGRCGQPREDLSKADCNRCFLRNEQRKIDKTLAQVPEKKTRIKPKTLYLSTHLYRYEKTDELYVITEKGSEESLCRKVLSFVGDKVEVSPGRCYLPTNLLQELPSSSEATAQYELPSSSEATAQYEVTPHAEQQEVLPIRQDERIVCDTRA